MNTIRCKNSLRLPLESGNAIAVRDLLNTGNCDVNEKFCRWDNVETIPLFVALSNIVKQHDPFYQISEMLLDHNDIDVNKEQIFCTILGRLCETQCASTLGIELLLRHKDIAVNKGVVPGLYNSCKKVKQEADYFYKVTQLLLQRPDIDVNVQCCGASYSLLRELCFNGCKSTLG